MTETPIKRCSTCKRDFPPTAAYFAKRVDSPDGLRGQCRECQGGTFMPWLDVVAPTGFRICRNAERCVHTGGAQQPETEEFFYWQSNGTLDPVCKDCRKAFQDRRYADNKEEINAKNRAYHAAHREQMAARGRAYRERNRDTLSAKRREYRERNRDLILAKRRADYAANPQKYHDAWVRNYAKNRQKRIDYQKTFRLAHPDKLAARSKAYAQRNRPHIRVYQRKWKERNIEKVRVSNRNHKAMRRGAPGSHTPADIRLQIKGQTDKHGRLRCWWCGEPIPDKYHVDHVIPLSKGGTNNPDNLVISCPQCNLSKFDHLPQEWNGRLL